MKLNLNIKNNQKLQHKMWMFQKKTKQLVYLLERIQFWFCTILYFLLYTRIERKYSRTKQKMVIHSRTDHFFRKRHSSCNCCQIFKHKYTQYCCLQINHFPEEQKTSPTTLSLEGPWTAQIIYLGVDMRHPYQFSPSD